ncbi:DMT family transporter [Alicyclobacillus macrosporangiidus]|uniref:Putative multidrug resistance efflux transporter n=1 Tax=Alicyclobacillus macrosporangiidus TaxID=392015 RepID=A0A1I7KUN0_9BACL|nr:multidrug resistance efflux transporter family protein [Alicyclobacillus macrosporangiidus]SFV01212.1 Putative multidrug resistance efflux transporter [Alicyclobacillus macrosporangiidus]
MRGIVLGVLSSAFFAATFLLNRKMSLSGGSWVWSASLRYLWMVPILGAVVAMRRRAPDLWREMRRHPVQWLVWSSVGFGLFYVPLCFSAAYGPAWLLACTWQITILAGSLVAPWIHEPAGDAAQPVIRRRGSPSRIPLASLAMSLVILAGIALVEFQQAKSVPMRDAILAAVPVLLAAFAYPLGNRKMMALCGGRLHAYERTFGMTLASLPLWLALAAYGMFIDGPPSLGQVVQSLLVAVLSGVVATVLFFSATDRAHGDPIRLAAVEATQSGEVLFTALAEWLFLCDARPSPRAVMGMGMVVLGMVCHSFTAQTTSSHPQINREAESQSSS